MSERIEFPSSRSGVECLFVEQGGKKMGGADPLKISSRSCFVRTSVRVEGTGKGRGKVTEWAVSELGWCGRRERARERRRREELKVSE